MNRSSCSGTRHGDMSAYTRYGCRCPDAREEWRLYGKRRREGRPEARKVPVVGMSRRLKALMAIGYDFPAMSQLSGLPVDTLKGVAQCRRANTYRHVAERVCELYRQLSMIPGRSVRAVTWAQRQGYAPPLAWDDDTIDDPAAKPEGASPAPLQGLPPLDELLWLIDCGESPLSIATRFGVRPATVDRALLRHREAA
jgi:hypothetical protein